MLGVIIVTADVKRASVRMASRSAKPAWVLATPTPSDLVGGPSCLSSSIVPKPGPYLGAVMATDA